MTASLFLPCRLASTKDLNPADPEFGPLHAQCEALKAVEPKGRNWPNKCCFGFTLYYSSAGVVDSLVRF